MDNKSIYDLLKAIKSAGHIEEAMSVVLKFKDNQAVRVSNQEIYILRKKQFNQSLCDNTPLWEKLNYFSYSTFEEIDFFEQLMELEKISTVEIHQQEFTEGVMFVSKNKNILEFHKSTH